MDVLLVPFASQPKLILENIKKISQPMELYNSNSCQEILTS